jgi:hypothetical protein
MLLYMFSCLFWTVCLRHLTADVARMMRQSDSWSPISSVLRMTQEDSGRLQYGAIEQ